MLQAFCLLLWIKIHHVLNSWFLYERSKRQMVSEKGMQMTDWFQHQANSFQYRKGPNWKSMSSCLLREGLSWEKLKSSWYSLLKTNQPIPRHLQQCSPCTSNILMEEGKTKRDCLSIPKYWVLSTEPCHHTRFKVSRCFSMPSYWTDELMWQLVSIPKPPDVVKSKSACKSSQT